VPKKLTQWEVYRPIRGSSGAFIGVVEAPDETSALKAAIEEFGIINPEYRSGSSYGEYPATMIRLPTQKLEAAVTSARRVGVGPRRQALNADH
jgi:hypothetical protein